MVLLNAICIKADVAKVEDIKGYVQATYNVLGGIGELSSPIRC